MRIAAAVCCLATLVSSLGDTPLLLKLHHRSTDGAILNAAEMPFTARKGIEWADFLSSARRLLQIPEASHCVVVDGERSELRDIDELEHGQVRVLFSAFGKPRDN